MPEGDQDDPGDDPRKRAAAQRAQPIPHNTSTAIAPALRYRSQPDKSIRAIGLCAGESCKGCGFCGNHEKRDDYGNADAGDEPAGAAGGWQQ